MLCLKCVRGRLGRELAPEDFNREPDDTIVLDDLINGSMTKNLLWVAKQHGHSVEVMLRMYAAWLDGATDTDIYAIKQAMERRPAASAAVLNSRAAISSVNAATNRARLIVLRPPESPEFGSRLAVGNSLSDSSLRNDSKIQWRRGWDCSRPGTAARPPLRSGPPRPGRGVQKSLRDFCRTRLVRPHILHRQ
jgi:hypothetical protein